MKQAVVSIFARKSMLLTNVTTQYQMWVLLSVKETETLLSSRNYKSTERNCLRFVSKFAWQD